MGQVREVDAIGEAIIATENEIAGNAWDIEDTDPADETGDRALESMGDGLEGQHEAGEETDDEVSEETDEEVELTAEEQAEADAAEAAAAGKTGEGKTEPPAGEQQPQGRVPSAKLREEADKRRAVETERDGLKAELETLKAQGGNKGEIAELRGQIATLSQQLQGVRPPQPRAEADTRTAPAEAPDIFENPKGFVEHLQQGFRTELDRVVSTMRNNTVQMSFENAGSRHGDAFTNAMAAVEKLNPQNPADRQLVQSIYNSPNPGEALVKWHKRSETLSRVGDDPAAFEERIRTETRQSLLKDPEFRKQLIADIRGEAATGDNGSPRTATRLPPALARAPGASRLSGERVDQSASDDTDQGVADAAWR